MRRKTLVSPVPGCVALACSSWVAKAARKQAESQPTTRRCSLLARWRCLRSGHRALARVAIPKNRRLEDER